MVDHLDRRYRRSTHRTPFHALKATDDDKLVSLAQEDSHSWQRGGVVNAIDSKSISFGSACSNHAVVELLKRELLEYSFSLF